MQLRELVGWVEKVKSSWQPYLEEKLIVKPQEQTLKEKILEAKREWLNARNYFDNVSDPELIDHAAYLLKAAESKYMFFLKQVKKIEETID